MLDSPCPTTLIASISQVILGHAMRHADDVMHIHVLQDVLQKLRQPRYYDHPEFATGYTSGEGYYTVHAPASPFTLDEVVAVLRGNLDHQDHDDLNVFYQQVMGCPKVDYAYRVGFVCGWLSAVITHGNAPVSQLAS